jgi:hypothetical protein
MTQHKEICTFKNFHRSLWHRLGEWEYELCIDDEGVFYKVDYLMGLHPQDKRTHNYEYHVFKFCPVCGAEIEKEQ